MTDAESCVIALWICTARGQGCQGDLTGVEQSDPGSRGHGVPHIELGQIVRARWNDCAVYEIQAPHGDLSILKIPSGMRNAIQANCDVVMGAPDLHRQEPACWLLQAGEVQALMKARQCCRIPTKGYFRSCKEGVP